MEGSQTSTSEPTKAIFEWMFLALPHPLFAFGFQHLDVAKEQNAAQSAEARAASDHQASAKDAASGKILSRNNLIISQ
mgnify:CR=1 FL=1